MHRMPDMPLDVDGERFQMSFEPPLDLPGKSEANVELEMPSGHAKVFVRCMITHALIEVRPDCQLIDGPTKSLKICVAAPESVKRYKLKWKTRFLRWLAK